jgi:excisionase family DNA binding protein
MNDDDEIITAQEAAEILRLHLKTVYRLIRTGEIPAQRLGPRSWRIKRGDVLALVRWRQKNSEHA